MKKYIETNGNNDIIDVFFEYQASKMDSSSKIFLEDTDIKKHYIKGSSISNEFGAFIFKWVGKKVVKKTKSEINNDQITIDGERSKIIKELSETDKGMARVTEDIFENILNGTPIPQVSINKINDRKALRAKL